MNALMLEKGTLILYAVVLLASFFNTVLIRFLPFAEGNCQGAFHTPRHPLIIFPPL